MSVDVGIPVAVCS